jgi:hypothetical protein
MNKEAATQQSVVPSAHYACNIDGIPLQERTQYRQLFEALLGAIDEKRELPDGYAFRIKGERITTGQLVEWINLERQCCPFFGFQILWEPENGPLWLRLTGRQEVKDFILDEFGLR